MNSAMNNSSDQDSQGKTRLDKWLWAARFYKTRATAKQAIDGGKVHCGGARVKPGKDVNVGMVITLRQGFDEKTVLVTGLSEQRRGAAEAQLLYQETPESIQQRELQAAQRRLQPGLQTRDGRPSKRNRRLITQFKSRNQE